MGEKKRAILREVLCKRFQVQHQPVVNACLHILVVDDDPNDRALAVQLLQDKQHQVDTAKTGEEAIRAAEKAPYDLVFMDLEMPQGLDGFETTRQIKALPGGKGETSVIALTFTKNPEDVRKCFQMGMSNFVLKPITNSKIEAIIATYVRNKNERLSESKRQGHLPLE